MREPYPPLLVSGLREQTQRETADLRGVAAEDTEDVLVPGITDIDRDRSPGPGTDDHTHSRYCRRTSSAPVSGHPSQATSDLAGRATLQEVSHARCNQIEVDQKRIVPVYGRQPLVMRMRAE